ncbi:MAG: PEGA domain-containing protein, partial [Steroidobacteraceae bacterium]|nr:PEGA domain-containing protein [Steroidobacteraceae bacterium]
MNDVALANRSDVGIVALREPAGERQLPAPAGIGGAGARVIVPQAADGEQLRLLFDGSHWSAEPVERGVARLNGEPLPLTGAELRAGDVLALGAAQIVVTELEGSRAQIEVRHLAGNDTVAPLQAPPARGEFDDEADVDVVAPDNLARIETWRGRAARGARRARPRATLWAAGATIAVALAAVFGLLGRLQRVALDVQPRDAQVESVGRWFSWHSGATLLVLPGRHQLRVTRAGYAPVTQQIEVDGRPRAPLRLRLEKLPGRIAIDTGGIPAEVYADGAPVGRAPGIVQVPAGRRTITVRAERYVDAVQSLEVEGADVLQNLQFKLQSSWGKLEVRSATPGAQVAANDGALQTVPAILDLPAGVHRVRLVAPQAKPWESTVIVKAGDITRLGPITLGAPDAELRVRSDPSGADVTVGGVFKGRTPLTVPLPAGASYEILVVRPGYRPWSRSVAAAAGARLDLTPRLEPIWVSLAVSGEPADAELLVDGQPRGRTPQTLQLTATVHAIEVRKPGSEPFKAQI